jgi:hypothetical protein
VAIYNTVLNSSQVQQLYQVGFPNTLFSNNLVVAYVLSNTTYYAYDGISHFYIKPYFANQQILSQLGISNASLVTITPIGQVGWVPFTQWQHVTNYSVISYCKLMNYYTFNHLGGSEYQVVLVTNQNMNQFPLDYQFLITSGSGSQSVLPVYAYGNTNTFTNTTTTTPTASAFLPVCDAPPTTVATTIETTAVTPVCNTNNIGYTTTNLEKLPNGTTYTYTLTYILGTNASNLPPGAVSLPAVAYMPIFSLMVAVILFMLLFARWYATSWRVAVIALAIITMVVTKAVASPYVNTTINCITGSSYATTTTTVPNPYYPYVTTAYIALFAVVMVAVTLQLYDSLLGGAE